LLGAVDVGALDVGECVVGLSVGKAEGRDEGLSVGERVVGLVGEFVGCAVVGEAVSKTCKYEQPGEL